MNGTPLLISTESVTFLQTQAWRVLFNQSGLAVNGIIGRKEIGVDGASGEFRLDF